MVYGQQAMARLDELTRFTETHGELTRRFLSDAHKQAALQVQDWMQQAGMTAHIDDAGSVVGRYGSDARTLMIGSHIDTVVNAGKYDGNFGVIAAIEAIAALPPTPLPFAIEILAFGDEEGVRFPKTLSGSKAVAGCFDEAALDGCDQDGVSMRAALQAFGCNPDHIPTLKRTDLAAYIELHIEQGPVLERENRPLGVVSAINGATRLNVSLTGTAGHAGTVPMTLRRDTLAAAADMILAIESLARQIPDLVATVGQIRALPNAANVIAGQTIFSVDLRAPDDRLRDSAHSAITGALHDIAQRRLVGIEITRTHQAKAARCDPALQAELAAAIKATGHTPLTLPSGAGHDAMVFTGTCPMAMMFVRCAGGISHNPAESITAEDADHAIQALLHFIRNTRIG